MIQQPVNSEEEELSHQIFELMIQYVDARLAEEDWVIDYDLCGIYGEKWYRHEISGADASQPKLSNSIWQFELLQSLPILIVPGESADGSLLWQTEVRFHSIPTDRVVGEIHSWVGAANDLCSDVSNEVSGPESDAIESYSLLNSLKFTDDIPAATGGVVDDLPVPPGSAGARGKSKRGKYGRRKTKNSGAVGEWVLMRQLVVGRWDGPVATPCLEVVGPAPAVHGLLQTRPQETEVCEGVAELETWHETTLAAVALGGMAAPPDAGVASQPCRVLLLGASLAAVTAFLNSLFTSGGTCRKVVFSLVGGIDNGHNAPQLSEFVRVCLRGVGPAPVPATGGGSVEVEVLEVGPSKFLSTWKRCNVGPNCSYCCDGGCLCGRRYDAVLVGAGTDVALCPTSTILQPWGTLAAVMKEEAGVGPLPKQGVVASFDAVSADRKVYRLYESTLSDGSGAECPAKHQYVVYASMPNSRHRGGLTVEWWLESITRLNSSPDEDGVAPTLVAVPADAGGVLPLAMDVFAAQKTTAVRIPALVTPEEAADIHSLAGKCVVLGDGGQRSVSDSVHRIGREIRSKDNHLWEVLFLQTDGAFFSALPGVLEKATRAVCEVDRVQGWGLLSGGAFSVRVVEYHTQHAPSSAIGDTHHYDQDSLVTLDIMLSQPGEDFAGADIQTLEEGGSFTTHPVSQYDALCFVSHKYHSVKPLLRGRRVVCVLEFWRGTPANRHRTCPHRCLAVKKPCPLETGFEGAEEVQNKGTNCVNDCSDRCVDISPPFTLAAARHRLPTDQFAATESSSVINFGGDVGIFWQASIASDGVDDKKPQVIVSLGDKAAQELDDMFGDD